MGRLDGKVALITGAGSGIGKAMAEKFVQEGAKVVVADINGEKAEAVARALAPHAVALQVDVSKLEDNKRAVAKAVEAFGKLDVFVGNAGVFDGFLSLPQIAEDKLEALFDRLFAINVKGYLFGAKAALPELLKTQGNMIFTASTAGFYTNQGGIVYTMSKHAVVGLIRELAYELAPKVRVNGVAPGGTFTDLRNAVALGQEFGDPDKHSLFDMPGLDEFIKQSTPLRRVNSPEDHAAVAAFLASEEARGLTGVIVHSDGGYGIRGATTAAGGDNL
jgi:NAD(P)-dependent dehydrogenase (short-subunit alcohol dehydrogenase family)